MSTKIETFSIALAYADFLEEYGGVIVVAIAIVALITVVFFFVVYSDIVLLNFLELILLLKNKFVKTFFNYANIT